MLKNLHSMPAPSYYHLFFKERFTEKWKLFFTLNLFSFFNKQIVAAALFHKIKVHGRRAFDHKKHHKNSTIKKSQNIYCFSLKIIRFTSHSCLCVSKYVISHTNLSFDFKKLEYSAQVKWTTCMTFVVILHLFIFFALFAACFCSYIINMEKSSWNNLLNFSFFVFQWRKKFIKVWDNMTFSKLLQNIHFQMIYPFKTP